MSKYNAKWPTRNDAPVSRKPHAARDYRPEHPAIDSLRSVANMARTTACLLDDARIYRQIPDEQEYAQFLATVAHWRQYCDALGCGRCAAGDG
jgi:hypothetical protein